MTCQNRTEICTVIGRRGHNEPIVSAGLSSFAVSSLPSLTRFNCAGNTLRPAHLLPILEARRTQMILAIFRCIDIPLKIPARAIETSWLLARLRADARMRLGMPDAGGTTGLRSAVHQERAMEVFQSAFHEPFTNCASFELVRQKR